MTQIKFHTGNSYTVLESHSYIPGSEDKPFEQDSFQGAKDILSLWLRNKFGNDVSISLQAETSFTHIDGENSSLEVICNEQLWAFRALYTDKDGRSWITEVSLEKIPSRKTPNVNRVNVDVIQRAVLAEGEQTALPHYPEFLGRLAAEYGLQDNQFRLSLHPGVVITEIWVKNLAKRLKKQEFNQPIVIFTPPEGGRKDSKEQEARWQEVGKRVGNLARETAGVAHVLVFDKELDGVFRREMDGDGMHAGNIRIYPPKAKPDRSFSLFTAIQNRPRGWDGFFTFLTRRLAQTSHFPNTGADLGPFLQAQSKITPEELIEIDPTIKTDFILNALIEITSQLDALEAAKALDSGQNSRTAAAEIKKLIERLATFKNPDAELTSLIQETQDNAQALRTSFLAAHYGITKPYQEKYDTLATWIDEHYAGRVVLSEEVRKALINPKAPKYNDINLVYAAVELLATHYYMMKMSTGSGQELHRQLHDRLYKRQLQKLGLEDTRSLSPANEVQFKDDYTVKVDGERHFLQQHLKHGNSPDPRDSLRIYYAWDDTKKRVVIGGLFKHKPNSLTN